MLEQLTSPDPTAKRRAAMAQLVKLLTDLSARSQPPTGSPASLDHKSQAQSPASGTTLDD